ncbi:hypothetical protein B0H16DRAFT_1744598 [Mycena metata]|uniref:Uncharacterized protein n=1 Tax=Mycena metata TaxID=1033252 RepID=A0AAD7H4U8_9AGAR|nr:hypothetical protein B0H16DRAFT_1744598 [Mycena metata]
MAAARRPVREWSNVEPNRMIHLDEPALAREQQIIKSHLQDGLAFAAQFKANLPFFTEDDAFKLIRYFNEFLTLTDRLRELGLGLCELGLEVPHARMQVETILVD